MPLDGYKTIPAGDLVALLLGRLDRDPVALYRATRDITQDDAAAVVRAVQSKPPADADAEDAQAEEIQRLIDGLGLQLVTPHEIVFDPDVPEEPCFFMTSMPQGNGQVEG